MKKATGFTLLELVVTILIVGIIAVSVSSRFANQESFAVKVDQENLISALNEAQQLAMTGQTVTFVITAGSPQTYAVNISGAPVTIGSFPYPQNAQTSVILTPASLTLSYNKLGETTDSTITVSSAGGGSATVTVEASGYAH